MSKTLVILLIVSSTSVVTFTAGQGQKAAVDCSECHPYALCEGLNCSCKAGFTGDGLNCSDIDECADSQTHNCSVGTCENTVGSYICFCPRGYIHSNGSCEPINECANPSLYGCHPFAKCINNMYRYICVCPDGYYGDGSLCEIDECQRGVCGFGNECTKSFGSYICSDPCVTRNMLDEPWRSTNYTLSPFNKCDKSKYGWYRFVGSGGVRIPENCVSEYRCGSQAPVWMNGAHPVIRDGIVDRTACANWIGDCCYLTSTFQVKACSQGYYVYKISGIPGSSWCFSSYCTDPSTRLCKADEEWKLRNNQYECVCKEPYKVTAFSQVVPELTCGSFEMTATFHKCQFNHLNIYFNKTHVKDNACYDFQDDPVTNTFKILAPLKVGSCGVNETNNTNVTYKTNITINVDTFGTTSGNKTLTATLQCSYKLDMTASLNLVPNPILSITTVTVVENGQSKVYMSLYKDSNYTSPYTGSDVALSTEKFLYVGVFSLGGPSNFVLVMKNCYATPTNNMNDSSKYPIIQNSCKTKADGTISVAENGVSNQGRFSVQMFKFVGNSTQVYLHCAVSLCGPITGSCASVCVRADSQSDGTIAPQSYDGALSIGPITQSDPIPTTTTTTPQPSSPNTTSAGSSIITSAHIFWSLLIPALTLLIQSL